MVSVRGIPGGEEGRNLWFYYFGSTIFPLGYLIQYNTHWQIQDLVKEGPQIFWLIFADSAQQSCANEVSPYWLGSGACLRALEAVWFFITKYAFSPFWSTFLYYF